MNNDDNFMVIGAKLAEEMEKILLKKVKDKPIEDIFKISTYAIPSLIANFIDTIIGNQHPSEKILLLDNILSMSKSLLHVKEMQRQSNKSDKH